MTVALIGCTTVRPPKQITQTSLPRPVVVIGGYMDPWLTATSLGRWLKRNAGEQRVIAVHPGMAASFDDAAETVVEQVERYFPGGDERETAPVDVIGISMGGLVARHAAAPNDDGRKRLNIKRLYTLAAPHSGAQAADWFGFFGTGLAMRSGSPFLERLARRERLTDRDNYPLVAYARDRDLTVAYGTALPAHLAGEFIRLGVPWYASGHLQIYRDRRILRDLLRRLRTDESTTQPTTRPATWPTTTPAAPV